MLGKSKISRFLFAGVVTVALFTTAVLFTGCPEEPAGFDEPAAPEPVDPAEPEEELPEPEEQEPQEPLELPEM